MAIRICSVNTAHRVRHTNPDKDASYNRAAHNAIFINHILFENNGDTMEVIIPMAGKGTRMRPHTLSMPKPLMHVAGKPMLAHILDQVLALKPDKIHFVISGFQEQVEAFLQEYDFAYTLSTQEVPNGDGGAILLTKPHVNPDSDVLVVFSDTIYKGDMGVIEQARKNKEHLMWVQEVEDPRRFGVVFLKDGYIVDMIEKPEKPVSNLVLVGMYYLTNAAHMFDLLEKNKKQGVQSKGEYRLLDAMKVMAQTGEKIKPAYLDAWLDCGTPETTLETNKVLLKEHNKVIPTKNSVIIDPVYIEEGASITHSVIGPNVSIAKGVVIDNSIVRNSIIGVDAKIAGAQIDTSMIGKAAVVEGVFEKVNVGQNCQLVPLDK